MTALSSEPLLATMVPPAAGRLQTRRAHLSRARQRALAVAVGVVLLAVGAEARIGWLYHTRIVINAAAETGMGRAEIVDRNGHGLATMTTVQGLMFVPDFKGLEGAPLFRHTPDTLADELVQLIPGSRRDDLRKGLMRAQPVLLAPLVAPDFKQALARLGEPALQLVDIPARGHPEGALAASVLGSTGFFSRRWFDQWHAGQLVQPGQRPTCGHYDRGTAGAGIHGLGGLECWFDTRLSDPAQLGQPVRVTLDKTAQALSEDSLEAAIRRHQAEGGAVVVLDVDTGEVRALASMTRNDPPDLATSDRNWGHLPYNIATYGRYELGSVFKPVTFAAAFEADVLRDLGKRWSTAPVPAGRRVIHDDATDHFPPEINAAEALVRSSNTVTARIAGELGPARLEAAFHRFHFFSALPLQLDGMRTPEMPKHGNDGHWGPAETMTAGFGQGMTVTPLHLAAAYAALVNGGLWHAPTLLPVVQGSGGGGERVISPDTSVRIRKLLRLVVVKGTGTAADVPGYRVGGKTGTAIQPRGNGHPGYDPDSLITTFAAVFPIEAPRYVVVATLIKPQKVEANGFHRKAAQTAAPLAGEIIRRIAPTLGVEADPNRNMDLSDVTPLISGKVDE